MRCARTKFPYIALNICRRQKEPVSYTHLDVYKRQGLGWRGTLRGAGAGDEGRTVEDVLLRALGLAVCTANFGEGPVRCGLGQGCVGHGGRSRSMILKVGRAAITHDVLVFIRPVSILFASLIVQNPQPEPDIKGLRAAVRGAPMNGGLAAALDVHPRWRYTAHKAAVG